MRTITSKLTRIFLIVSVSVVFMSGVISQVYLYQHARSIAHKNIHTQVVAMAGNLESAVAFGDAAFTQQTLNALQHYPDVRIAAVILPDGSYIAKFIQNADADTENRLHQLVANDEFTTGEYQGIAQNITRLDAAQARLMIIASLEHINREMLLTMAVSLAIALLVLSIAYILFQRMSRVVIRPIEDLTSVMRTVERGGDHGQRAEIASDDEVGELARGFNAMLTTLEKKNIVLNDELEERKRIEAEIRGTKNQLQATLDAVPDLMFEVGLDGRYYDYHSPQSELLAAPAETLVGRTIFDVLPADAVLVCLAALREANEKGRSGGMQFALPLPQGVLWFELSVARKEVAQGDAPRFVVLSRDITGRKKVEDEVTKLAFYDPLTGLPNRRLLRDRLKQAMAFSTRSEGYGALILLDLDNFKTLNDTRGHDAGDLLLQEAARRLVACVRESDTVARLGGDEFVVVLEGLSKNEGEAILQAELAGNKILAALDQPYQFDDYAHRSTASIGVSLFADHDESVDDLMKRADLAMYQAKAADRNTLRFFDPVMQHEVTARVALEAELCEAVLKNQLLLYYQPQVACDGRVSGAEALVRWNHPLHGMVLPNDFIPLAERSGLILTLGAWVLETACAQLVHWAAQPEMEHFIIAVNVSARQFHMADFVEQVLTVLDKTGANPMRLTLELTESLLVVDVNEVIAKMNALKARGVRFSLDDFGTGYSSLSYLKRLPLDQLKIDQGFVKNILIDANDAAIAEMVISLAERMGLTVMAEGVETEDQRAFLADQGCLAYQGYLFSRPLPLQSFEEFAMRDMANIL